MRDMIAVLDGLGSVNPSGSAGANYGGGSSFAPGFPTYQSSEGLAAYFGDASDMTRLPPGSGMPQSVDVPNVMSPGPGDMSIDEAYMQNINGDTAAVEEGYRGYLAAFEGSSFVATRETAHMNPSGSGGANYSGGSDYYPGAPTLQSSEGLARVLGGYEVTRQRNPSGSGGANYSGGSDFYPGAPTYPSSEGLATLHRALAAGHDPVTAVQMGRRAAAAARWRAY